MASDTPLPQMCNLQAVFRTQLDKFITEAKVVAADTNHTYTDLKAQVDIVQRSGLRLSNMDVKIQSRLTDPAEIVTEVEESDAFQHKVLQVLIVLNTCISVIQRRDEDEHTFPGSQDSQIVFNHHSSPNSTQAPQLAKLPTLELPKFNGNPLTWQSFWDCYESSVHDNAGLSPVTKFTYLRGSLKGVAFNAVAGIAVTNLNYPTAVDLIKERFGKPQIIVGAHVEDLLSIPKATSDTNSLRNLYDNCEIHIRGLEALDIPNEGSGVILTPILLSKVPDEVRLILSRRNKGSICDLETFRELFREEIEAREENKVHKLQQSSTPRSYGRPQEPTFSTGALLTSERKVFCGFCRDNGHNSFNCSRYSTVNQRMAKVKEDRLCMNCLHPKHKTMDCKNKQACRNCNKFHHTTLCFKGGQNGSSDRPSAGHNYNNQPVRSNVNLSTAEQHDTVTPGSTPTLLTNSTSIWMQTALATIPDQFGHQHTVRLLFDSGSHRSYVTQAVTSKLSLKSDHSEVLSIAPFGQKHGIPKRFQVTTLECSPRNQSSVYRISAAIVPSITCPIYRTSIGTPSSMMQNLYLADPLSDMSQQIEIDILVGLDHYWDLINSQSLRLPDEKLIAVSSVFGWLVSGTIEDTTGNNQQSITLFIGEDMSLKKFWETESLEHVHTYPKDEVFQNEMVLQQFEKTITMKDGRYEVGLPWKENSDQLPTNYGLCLKRFKSLIKRLTKEGLVKRYNDVVQQQIERKFIEEVEQPRNSTGVVHYVSHHPVIKEDRATTKLRVVYDASAKLNEDLPSLNESLHTGPNLVSDLIGLLLQFREHIIVILADVKKAFLQVRLRPVDRDATRFLWLKDPTKPPTDDNIQIYRFLRVLFGATCSPFLLAATIRYHLQNTEGPIAAKMINKFYVDNLVVGADTVEEAGELYTEARRIMLNGGMNLREWISNSEEFNQSIPMEDRTFGSTIKVLGLSWNISEDVINIKGVPELVTTNKTTKRQILQTIAKVFDPLGFVSPVVVQSKIFIQKLWKLGISWDDAPSQEVMEEWIELNKQLSLLSTVNIPRRLVTTDGPELHIFVDASAKAYGAVAYIRSSTNGRYTSNIVCSKSRVAPIKPVTIPRLELLAAVMGCHLASVVSRTYTSTSRIQIWSDSQVVLYWIQSKTKKQGLFVSNRVRNINEYNYNFRYCPTSDNPADLPSRGMSTPALISSHLWWYGPSWLVNSENTWPANVTRSSSVKPTVTALEPVLISSHREPSFPFDMDPNRYSSIGKLLRVTAYCQRFVRRKNHDNGNVGPILTDEYNAAQHQWIKAIQQNEFGDQFGLLKAGKVNSTTKKLSMYLDDDIIRCHGRISNATTSHEAKNPIMLPKRNAFTDLIIKDIHNRTYHQGVRQTLSTIRQRFWLQNGRQQVRFILKRCPVCKLWEGPSFSNPPPPPLPTSRVTKGPAFSYTGCDFAGPVYVYSGPQVYKAYICLFTCAVTRAVHLEAVEDLTTFNFLLALRRFMSRRGVPIQIISDNAKTFKLGNQILDRIYQNVVTSEDTVNYISSQNISWKYNVERAPWWGGFFERMVGLTKRTLLKAVGKTKLSFQELATFLAEVEAILNSRPLTYVHDDLNEDQPLCPRNFLSEARFFGIPTISLEQDQPFNETNVTAKTLISKLHHRQRLLDKFWNMWSSDYLTSLREDHLQVKEGKINFYTPHIGDVVLIKEEGMKRACWKKGIIIYLFRSQNDNQIRAAQVQCNGKVLQRSVSHLYPLEIITETESTREEDQSQAKVNNRPTRNAAAKAKQAIKDMYISQPDEHSVAGVS